MSVTTILPKSSIVRVRFDFALPVDASKDDVLEWVSDCVGCGGISLDNALISHVVEALNEPVLEETGQYLHQTVVQGEGNGFSIFHQVERYPSSDYKTVPEIISERNSSASPASQAADEKAVPPFNKRGTASLSSEDGGDEE